MNNEYIKQQLREHVRELIQEHTEPQILSESEISEVNEYLKKHDIDRAKVLPLAKGDDIKILYKVNNDSKPNIVSIKSGKVEYDGPLRKDPNTFVASLLIDGYEYVRSERKLKQYMRNIAKTLTKPASMVIGAAVAIGSAVGIATVGFDFVPRDFIDAESLGKRVMDLLPQSNVEEVPPASVDVGADADVEMYNGYPVEEFGGLTREEIDKEVKAMMDLFGMSEENATKSVLRTSQGAEELRRGFSDLLR